MYNAENCFSKLLLEWWKTNKRDFPWRHTKDPYAVLMAEMLLRKTTARQVGKIYKKFLTKYPNPESLYEADKDELDKLLEPLGMEHKRAELFIKFGTIVKQKYSGAIPPSLEDLLKLPGVGRYAGNAVLSFAYLENVPLLDTNFIRIVQRVFGVKSSKHRARDDEKIWEFAMKLVPACTSRDFNLAVLDFAALICKAKKPKCGMCPLSNICDYYYKEVQK